MRRIEKPLEAIRTMLFLGVFVVGAAAPVPAQTSIGIMLGEPTGISAKQWIGGDSSIDVAVAWSFLGAGSFYAHADYQVHFDDLDIDTGDLLWFVGAGVKTSISSTFSLGLRIPLGLVYQFAEAPIEIFVEAAPGMLVFPAVTFNGGGGIGVRFRF